MPRSRRAMPTERRLSSLGYYRSLMYDTPRRPCPVHKKVSWHRTGAMRTSDLFNSGQKLGGLQPLSFQGTGYRDRSRTSCRPHKVGWLVLGLRPAGARGERSDSKEVWEQNPKSECPSQKPQAEV